MADIENCTVHFNRGRTEYTLNYPYCLMHNTLPKLRKLFEAMCFEYWNKDNKEAIKKTNSVLIVLKEQCKMGCQNPYLKHKYERIEKVQSYFTKTVEKFGITHLLTE